MLARLKENRLKIVSALCILADVLMGLAGAAGIYHIGNNPGDLLLTAGSVLGLLGHGSILLWGKGGRAKKLGTGAGGEHPPVLLRPLLPWCYPLDFAFAFWAVASVAFTASGLMTGNIFLTLNGVICTFSATFGWLWPEEKKFYGFQSVQVSALLYIMSGTAMMLAGVFAHKPFIIAAGACYLTSSFIFYTVRKENQSRHTIEKRQPL
jgi:hypothetical protein